MRRQKSNLLFFNNAFIGLLLVLLAAEFALRATFGLGTVLVYVPHPTLEYIYKPNQDVTRFGKRTVTNDYGMRSGDFADPKPADGFRATVFGDSVVNGGTRLDNDELATTLSEIHFQHELPRKVLTVANVSMGSWGPANYLAFVKEYGTFETDIAVLVISSHDFYDVPTYQELNRCSEPTNQPLSAIVELLYCYVLPNRASPQPDATLSHPPSSANSAASLTEFLEYFKNRGISVHVIQHWDQTEIRLGRPHAGHEEIMSISNALASTVTQLGPILSSKIDAEHPLFLDNLHLDRDGQKVLSDIINSILLSTMARAERDFRIENR